MQHLPQIDQDCITALVDDALAAGLLVSVHDGEAFPVKRSTDRAEILGALCSTDEDRIMFADPRDPLRSFGWVALVYGNEPGVVIADYSDNERTQNLVKRAEALAAEFEEV